MTSLLIEPITIPGQQVYEDSVFPYGFAPSSAEVQLPAALNWLRTQHESLKAQATRHGAVLFRGFPLTTAEDFDALIQSMEVENFPYKQSLSNAVRVNFTERVFSANEAPPTVRIFLHHEMAQTPLYPTVILFFCEQAAEEGGATPICRSDILFDRLQRECPQFVRSLESKGLKYSNVMPAADDRNSGMGRSWQSTLGVATRQEAEARLANLGYSWNWLSDDSLRATTPVLPAVREIAPGRKTLFNQLIAAYSGWSDSRNDPSEAIRLGDDQKLDAASVQRLIALADELAFDMQWNTGDAVLIDNTVAMHGRRPFVGKRKVLASLGNMQTHAFTSAT